MKKNILKILLFIFFYFLLSVKSVAEIIDETDSYISISKGNVKVTLDKLRGGLIGSIYVTGQGELIENSEDGRGIGTSGLVVFDSVVLQEGGCHLNQGNTYVTTYSTPTEITVINYLSKNWNNCLPDSETTVGSLPTPYDLDITHTVSFPTSYDGVIRVDLTYTNNLDVAINSLNNTGFYFPISPQLHINNLGALTPNYWKYRTNNQSWTELPIIPSSGWLDPIADLKVTYGDAIAVYEDSNFGMALHTPYNIDNYYIKNMQDYSLSFIGSIWTLDYGIAARGSITKTYYIIIGTQEMIEDFLGNL